MDFDIAKFREVHNHNGQLNSITDATIQFWIDSGVMLLGLDKTTCLIKDENEKKLALQLLICHMCSIVSRQMVGTVTNASEGSVSVGTQIPPNLSRSWLCTTPCGLILWQLFSKYQKGIRWYAYKR